MADQNTPAIQQKAGNIGIGTSDPGSYKLNVNGQSVFQDHMTVNSSKYIYTNNVGANATATNLVIAGPNSANIVLTVSNVGIGTTSAPYKLTVSGDTSISGLLGVGSYIDLSGILYLRSNINVLNKAGNAWLSFATRDTSGTEALMNLSNIGTLTNANTAVLANPNYGRKIYYRFFTPPTSTGNSTHDVYLGRISYGITRITIFGDGYGAETGVCFEISRNWGEGTLPYIDLRHGSLTQIVSLHHQAVAGEVTYSDIFMKYTYNAPAGNVNNMYAVIETEGLSSWSVASPTTPTLDNSNRLPIGINSYAGNVGIGTTSSSEKLRVEGSTILNGNVSANTTYNGFALNVGGTAYVIGGSVWVNDAYGYANASSVNTGMFPDSTHNISFKNNNSTNVYIKSDGYVGIGTTSPSLKLHVNGGIIAGPNALYGVYISPTNENTINSGYGSDDDTRDLWLNYRGYNDGFTRYRDTRIGNGKGIQYAHFDGTNQRVGIGTTSPAYKLDVNGVVNATDYYFNSTSVQRAAKRYVSTAAVSNAGYTVVCNVSGDALASGVRMTFQGTADSTVINVTADILVNHYQDILITSQAGIYTVLTLRVKSDNNEAFSVEATTNSPNSCTMNVEVYPLNSESVTFGGAAQTGASLTHTCRPGVNISATGGSDGDFAASGYGYFGGNLGIGAYSPGNKLLISSAVGAAGFDNGISIITSPGTYTSGHGGMIQFQNEDVVTAGIRGVRESGWGSGMAFYVHNTSAGNTFGTTFVERMRINESGYVGIGTTSPYDKLEVNGAIAATGNSNGTSAQGHATIIAVSSGTSYLTAVDWGAEYKPLVVEGKTLDFRTGTGSTTSKMYVDNGGNVGIGIASPGYKLEINGNVGASSFFETSDIRLKTIIERNPSVSLNLDLVKYKKKDSDRIRYGYVAQEVKKFLPELAAGEDILSLNYQDIHSILIHQLINKINELEAKLNKQQ